MDSSYIPASPVIAMAEKLKKYINTHAAEILPISAAHLRWFCRQTIDASDRFLKQRLTAAPDGNSLNSYRYFLANTHKTICPVLSRSFPTWTAIYAMLYAAGLTTNCRWRISLAVWKPSERHSAETSPAMCMAVASLASWLGGVDGDLWRLMELFTSRVC